MALFLDVPLLGVPSGSEVQGFVVIIHDVSSDDDVADELLVPAQLVNQVLPPSNSRESVQNEDKGLNWLTLNKSRMKISFN